MEGSELQTVDLAGLMKEWRQLETEIEMIGAAIKEKRKRVKVVREMITKTMKAKGVGTINIKAGAVHVRETSAKAPITKKFLVTALTDFFSGNAEMATKCAAFLDEHRPLKTMNKLQLDPLAPSPGSK
jgi:hypothetical protein